MKNYPLWKSILVLSLVSLSFIFAIPSIIYQEEPENWFLDNKINLGLDLQGGSYLLLEVDSAILIKEELEHISDFVRKIARDEQVIVSDIQINKDEIVFRFKDNSSFEKIRIELLKNRTSDAPFIPKLVTLKIELKAVQLNNTLKTLEARQDDSPFVAEIVNLDTEKIKLESSIVDANGFNTMQLSQVALTRSIKTNKRQIVLISFIGGFMMSILLALVMDALKPVEKNFA